MKLLHHELQNAVESYGHRQALSDGKNSLTFLELEQQSTALAGALQKLGLGKGERLAILAHNSIEYIVWHYAAAKAGVIFHVLNTRLVLGELEWMINNAESAAIIAGEDFVETAQALCDRCASLKTAIGIEGVGAFAYATRTLLTASYPFVEPSIEADTAALMIYTSGTTGRPKGVLQSHGGSLLADQYTRDAVKISAADKYLALMPFFHQAGLIRTRATLLSGGQVIIPGKIAMSETADWLVDQSITFTMLASPQQYTAIREKLATNGSADFSALRMLLGGGGSGERAVKTIRGLCDALRCEYFGVYGQTESTGPAVFVTGDDVFERPASCGRPFPGVDIAIWDDQDNRLEEGSVGEIMIRGPITAKYWRNEEANNALYQGGWIHTGDLGYLDQDGFLYFKSRVKELVKTGAENVYPREVEAVLETHADIADVAIFGLPDREWGEIVCAAVVTREGQVLNLETIRNFCRGKIGGYKIPKFLIVVDQIARNHTGKILRAPLIAIAEEARRT